MTAQVEGTLRAGNQDNQGAADERLKGAQEEQKVRPIIWNASKGGGLVIVGVEGVKSSPRRERP